MDNNNIIIPPAEELPQSQNERSCHCVFASRKDFTLNDGCKMLSHKGVGAQDIQLNTYDYLADIPGNSNRQKMVEVQFKNTRKGYYLNSSNISLEKGDIVAVEAQPGHDIGRVTLTGQLVPLQMKKANLRNDSEIQRIYRIAKPNDMEKYNAAKEKEHDTMIRSRKIAKSLLLEMKIGDVEYQGDGNKAIFYYIADGRVDFRQLIRVLADTFRIRIEMKQIGARQEAGRIGGIGPCGRELCCATWMTTFVSVSTNAARLQDISLNPQRLAGQCAKLKCCLNYEVNSYVEAQKRLPSKQIDLHTLDATYYFFKVDVLTNRITYSTDPRVPANLITISSARAFEIINLNKANKNPAQLQDDNFVVPTKQSSDLLDETDLTRFDKKGNDRRGNTRRSSRGLNKGPRNFSKDNVSGDKPRSRPTNRRIDRVDTDKPVDTRRNGEQSRENDKRSNSRRNSNTTNRAKGERVPKFQGTKSQTPRVQSPRKKVVKPQAPQKSE